MAKQSDDRKEPDSTTGIIQRAIALLLRVRLVRAYLRYSESSGSSLADGITYRALFSVFAGILLGFSLAALWLGGDPEAMKALVETVDSVIPGLTSIVDLSKVRAPTGFTIVSLLSSVGLLGAAIGAVSSLRKALRIIADKPSDDGFFLWVMVRNLLVALGFGGLLGLAAALSVFSGIGIETFASWIGVEASGAVNTATRIASVIVIFVIDTAAVALVFRLLSGMKTSAKALWTGAIYGGLGLIVLQEFSSLFVRGATTNPLLVSFAALIALLLWFNLSAQVILIASSYIVVATEDEQSIFPARTLAQYRLSRAQDRLEVATLEFQNAQKVVREETTETQ